MIEIWTDGACSNNPGIGGWGAVIISEGKEESISGAEPQTTNNRMELLAAIKALEVCSIRKNSNKIKLFTDSEYVKKGMTFWVKKWQKNNWRTAARKPVKNKDLWQRLLDITDNCSVEWHWVQAHVGITNNEKADELARNAIKELQ